MFRTTREAELSRPVFVGEDIRLWSYVEHGLQLPWFYVRLVHHEDGIRISRMLMLSNIEMLQSVQSQRTSSSWVEDVQLVSPGYLNKTGRWLMEPLLELVEVGTGSAQSKSLIYRVMGDRIYTDGQQDNSVDQVKCTIYLERDQSDCSQQHHTD